MATTNTLLSWSIVIALSCAAYYYYVKAGRGKVIAARSGTAAEQTQTRSNKRSEEKKSSKDLETSSSRAGSASERTKKRKPVKKQADLPTSKSPVTTVQVPSFDDAEEEDDYRDFARQLAAVQKGIKLTSNIDSAPRGRTVRQSAANGTTGLSTSPSTTGADTGADADDDLSPALSPSPTTSAFNGTTSARNVSDMLEAPSTGPSVLKIGEPAQQARAKKPQQPREQQTQETKKQRQNRKKAEEKSLLHEQAEKARRVLEEQQRRTAREARGEPAKNGMVTSKPPAANAWAGHSQVNGNATSNGTSSTAHPSNAQLLDTLDDDGTSTIKPSDPAVNGTSGKTSGRNWESYLPSEEDQLQMVDKLMENSGWNTVKNPRKIKKKAALVESTDTEGSPAGSERQRTPTDGPSTHAVARSADLKGTKGNSASESAAQYQSGGHPDDSDWPVVG